MELSKEDIRLIWRMSQFFVVYLYQVSGGKTLRTCDYLPFQRLFIMRVKHKEKITMRHSCTLIVVALVLFSNCENAFSQSNTFPWPTSGSIGIGTSAPLNALHLNSNSGSDSAIIRLSNSTPLSIAYGIIGLMPSSGQVYSSLSTEKT